MQEVLMGAAMPDPELHVCTAILLTTGKAQCRCVMPHSGVSCCIWRARCPSSAPDYVACVLSILQGPTYSLKVDGGSCEIMKDGSVQCSQPAIKITRTPLTCNLPYRKAASLEVGEGGPAWTA